MRPMPDDAPRKGRFRAVLLTVTAVDSVTPELRPFVEFRAAMEGRTPTPQDLVAIFQVHTTSSHFVVFMDAGKTIAQIESEISPYEVVLPAAAWHTLESTLESQATAKAARG